MTWILRVHECMYRIFFKNSLVCSAFPRNNIVHRVFYRVFMKWIYNIFIIISTISPIRWATSSLRLEKITLETNYEIVFKNIAMFSRTTLTSDNARACFFIFSLLLATENNRILFYDFIKVYSFDILFRYFFFSVKTILFFLVLTFGNRIYNHILQLF